MDAALDFWCQIVDATGRKLRRLQMDQVITVCRRCGASVTGEMRFCPSCGRGLARASTAFYVAVGCTAVGMLGVAIGLRYLAQPGRPDVAAANHVAAHVSQDVNDPQLDAMRKELNPELVIAVDGGVTEENCVMLAEAGAGIPLKRLGIPDGEYAAAADRGWLRSSALSPATP